MKWLNSLIFGYSVVEDDDNDNNDKFDDGNNKSKWQIPTEERELMVSSMTSFIIKKWCSNLIWFCLDLKTIFCV